MQYTKTALFLLLLSGCLSCSRIPKKDTEPIVKDLTALAKDTKAAAADVIKQNAPARSIPVVYEIETQAEFDQLFTHKKPVLVKFYSQTCPPCRYMKNIFAQAASEFAEEVVFVEVDVQARPLRNLVQAYVVQGIPCFVLLNTQKKEVARQVGRMELSEFREFVTKALPKAL